MLTEHLLAMIETLDRGTLRGLRDRAILLVGFSGALRRSEIVGLDVGREQSDDGRGWIEILGPGTVVTLRGKTGWREVAIGRGSSDATCPIAALQTWLTLARVSDGPLFRRVTSETKREVADDRLTDKHVARLVKQAAMAAGVRIDLAEGERAAKFSGHSLRSGLATSAPIERSIKKKHLGHTSEAMTELYEHWLGRFRVNLTKAAGL